MKEYICKFFCDYTLGPLVEFVKKHWKKHPKITVFILLFAISVTYTVYRSWDDIWFYLERDEKITVQFLEQDHTKKLVPMTSCKEFYIGEEPYTLDSKGKVLIPKNSVYHAVNNICIDRYYMVKTNESADFLGFEAVPIPVTARFTSPKPEMVIDNINELDFTISLFDINSDSVYVNSEDQLTLEAKKNLLPIQFKIPTSASTLHNPVPHTDIGLGPHTASVKYFYKNKKHSPRELKKHSYILKKYFTLHDNDKFIGKDTQVTISANGYAYLRAKKSMEHSVVLLSNIDMHKEHRVELQYTPTLATPISFIRFGDIKISIQNIKDGMISVSTADNCKVLVPQSGQYEMQTGPQVDTQTSVIVKITPIEYDKGIQYTIRIQIATEGKGYVSYIFKIKEGTGHKQASSNIYFGIKDSNNSKKFQELKFWDVFVY